MGLFVAKDGHYQGWLAAFLCCCAAVTEDEHPVERRRAEATPKTAVWTEQPQPLKTLPSDPYSRPQTTSTLFFKDGEPILEDDLLRPLSQRPPSLKPLDLGGSSLLGRVANNSWTRSRPNSSHGRQPSIDRQSLVPLKLSPVVLRQRSLSRSMDDENVSPRSTDSLMDPSSKRMSYRASRETPFQRCQQLSVASSPTATSPSAIRPMEPIEENQTVHPALTPQSSSSSMSSTRRQAPEAGAPSTTSRPSFEGKRLKRKRSFQRVRKMSGESEHYDIDREILELNTIVEERRADITRLVHPSDDEQYICAVAPSMPIRARSETLTSIGSAFARPSTAQPPATTPHITARLSQPFTNMPEPVIAQPSNAQALVRRRSSSRSSKRISGWLSDLIAQRRQPQPDDLHEPFYKCIPPASVRHQQRPVSVTSLCTTITESEAPALTAASSSPTSKGQHSRSLTAESRITPLSPPAVEEGYHELDEEKAVEKEDGVGRPRWPSVVQNPSQVGLAL